MLPSDANGKGVPFRWGRSVRTYFQSWSPREVVLLTTTAIASLLAAAFGTAWFADLVPFETVWGSVAAWASVAVTALGFIIAGLTFYLRFREVAQSDEEKKGEKDQQDLDSTYQLHQMTSNERQRMEEEASTVKLVIRAVEYEPSELPDFAVKYWVRFAIENGTGKRLTGILLHLPETTTHYDTYTVDGPFDVFPDSDEKVIESANFNIAFAGLRTKTFNGIGGPDLSGPMGAHEVFAGKAKVTFRVDGGGALWELLFDPDLTKQRPVMKLRN